VSEREQKTEEGKGDEVQNKPTNCLRTLFITRIRHPTYLKSNYKTMLAANINCRLHSKKRG